MRINLRFGTICLLALMLISMSKCKDDPYGDLPPNSPFSFNLPAHFPQPEVPVNNPMTEAKVALGRKLFFEKRLSLDSTLSCGSCHFQENGFSDPRQFSLGVNDSMGKRNAPGLINVVFGKSFFWDGANPTLETQAIVPLTSTIEMHINSDEAIRRIQADPEYVRWFDHVYQKTPDMQGLLDAIASFERSLLSYESPWDKFMEGDSAALNESAKRGWTLFNSEKAECFHCHGGYNFTDEDFHNNGLYRVYEDNGRWNVTGSRFDLAKFKSPTLRNIATTAPYMHDGSMQSLEEVVAHYASHDQPHINRSVFLPNITLTAQDQADIVELLHALTDDKFLTNPDYRQ